MSVEQLIDEIDELELGFQPGTNQSYSDLGYALAGRMAATVARTSFQGLMRSEIIEPAGLTRTFFPPPESELLRIATVEGAPGNNSGTAMYNSAYALGLAHPAFGVVSTLSDLLRFGVLIDPASDTRIHSRVSLQTMTTDQTGGDFAADETFEPAGVIHAWGIGFMIKGRSGNPEMVSPESYGHAGGSGCYLWIDPRYRVTMAFVSNRHYNADPGDFMPRLDQAINITMSCLTR